MKKRKVLAAAPDMSKPDLHFSLLNGTWKGIFTHDYTTPSVQFPWHLVFGGEQLCLATMIIQFDWVFPTSLESRGYFDFCISNG